MLLHLVRHGDCLSEAAPGVFTPDGELSPLGERQAALTARRLAAEGVARVLSSPLVRALATASAIAATAGDLPVEVWTELREGYGSLPGRPVPHWRGLSRAALLRRFPRAVLPPAIGDDGWEHGGDDAYAPFFGRARRVADRLRTELREDDRAVVVGHGGCLNYVLHALLGVPATAPVWFALGCCSVTTVRLVPEAERRLGWPLYPPVEVELLRLNDSAHLAGLDD